MQDVPVTIRVPAEHGVRRSVRASRSVVRHNPRTRGTWRQTRQEVRPRRALSQSAYPRNRGSDASGSSSKPPRVTIRVPAEHGVRPDREITVTVKLSQSAYPRNMASDQHSATAQGDQKSQSAYPRNMASDATGPWMFGVNGHNPRTRGTWRQTIKLAYPEFAASQSAYPRNMASDSTSTAGSAPCRHNPRTRGTWRQTSPEPMRMAKKSHNPRTRGTWRQTAQVVDAFSASSQSAYPRNMASDGALRDQGDRCVTIRVPAEHGVRPGRAGVRPAVGSQSAYPRNMASDWTLRIPLSRPLGIGSFPRSSP